MTSQSLSLHAIPDIPLIKPNDNLEKIILSALFASGIKLENNDIIAIAQKIISKAEGRLVDLATVKPSEKAIKLAQEINKDPRQIELVLSEAKEIIAVKPGVIIVEHHSGVILANAGIDHSNVEGSKEIVCLLPKDANQSAKRLKKEIEALCKKQIGIIITDSIGRPWRKGTTGVAIGSAGVETIRDLRGDKDMFGRELMVSETANADSLASAACLLMGEGDDATPVVLIRGVTTVMSDQDTRQLLRPKDEDMFR
ncbi:MAG: coenzyme F420-0:L-glutamate ligase [Proteobacteria bacterium]|nr:coenzyme F420-0:L-glutamate ligase [Pseudomonadota bacterium]NOG59547.1 coenzyme F420-0:L-glutamate ligase [Pseudomonadota bacterium]